MVRDRINGLREMPPVDPQARYAARLQQASHVELPSAVLKKETAAQLKEVAERSPKPEGKEGEQQPPNEDAQREERQHDELVLALDAAHAESEGEPGGEVAAAKLRLHAARQLYGNK
jgi:hypothetical protein